MNVCRRVFVILAFAGCSIVASHVAAQPIPTAASMTDTVKVSKDRLPANTLMAPIAVTEVAAKEFETARHIGLDEALNLVPGVMAQSRSAGQDVRITIRGFGARGAGERSNAGTTRGIRIQLDGFPLTEPDGRTSLDLADLGAVESIRVVRSNASALYGSASGGLIDLTTHSQVGARAFELRSSFGSFGLQRQHGYGVLPFRQSSVRVSYSDTRFEGWRRHNQGETSTLQASILSNLSDAAELGVFFAGTRNHNDQPGALTAEEFETDPRQADPTFVERNYRRENTIGRVGVRLQHGFRGSDLLSVSAYAEPKGLHRSERNRFRDFTRYHTGGSAMYRWQLPVGEDSKLAWTNGVDESFQDGAVLFYDLGPNGSRGPTLIANTREGINTLGIFSQLEFEPTERVELSAGARYDVIRFIFEDHQNAALDDAETMERVSPRVAASYRIRRGQSVFAAFSSGIEAPAFNEIDPPPPFDANNGLNPFLEPAHSFTLEVGTKGVQTLRDDGSAFLRYDLAVYGLEVRNDIIPFDGGAFYTTAGKSRRYGVEAGTELRLASGLWSRVACTVSHNRYVDYENDLGVFDDNESAGIAPVVLNARVGYEAPFGGFVDAGVHALGAYFADDANLLRVPAYGIVGLNVGARRPVGRGEMEGFVGVDNLLDEQYIASVFINGVGGRFIEPGMERSFLFGLRYRGR